MSNSGENTNQGEQPENSVILDPTDPRLPPPSASSPSRIPSNSIAAPILTGEPQSPPRWQANVELVEQIEQLGFTKLAAEKALFYTDNSDVQRSLFSKMVAAWNLDCDSHQNCVHDISAKAITWLLDNPSAAADINTLETEGESDTDDDNDSVDVQEEIDLAIMASLPWKMAFVVNSGLKMGAGKMAAQVGHATLAVYRKAERSETGRNALRAWNTDGETKVVLKAQNEEELDALMQRAHQAQLLYYLVHDAGRTQIAAGSQTVLGIFGTVEQVDSIVGELSLL